MRAFLVVNQREAGGNVILEDRVVLLLRGLPGAYYEENRMTIIRSHAHADWIARQTTQLVSVLMIDNVLAANRVIGLIPPHGSGQNGSLFVSLHALKTASGARIGML